MSVKIITDSACDITQERARELGIQVIPLTTVFGTEEYLDGVTLSSRQFFEKLVETDELPHTCQITPFQYGEVFREAAADGSDVICIVMSSKLSGSWQSAVAAAAEYDGRVTAIDSENICIGQQILVLYAAQLRDRGLSAAEIAAELEARKRSIRLLALLDTLEYLKRGGRISPAVAFAGELLSIKPVVTIEGGEVKLIGKARGSKSGNNLLKTFIGRSGGISFDMPYVLGYSGLSDCLLQKYIEDSRELWEGRTDELPVCSIGSTIGTHAGPGAIAVAFFEKPNM